MISAERSTSIYELSGLHFQYGHFKVLRNISLKIAKGEILGIVGPNGAGKTTLLRILCGLLSGWTGQLTFMDRTFRYWERRALARLIAYLPQQTRMAFPYTVREVALMGRMPHQTGSFFDTRADHDRVEEVLRLTDSLHLSDRYFQDLSGGEQQLVSLASALAQDPSVLLLDEPTVFLDLKHQLQIYRILKELHDEQGLDLIVVTHDLNLAQSFCDRLIFMKSGEIAADILGDDGPPEVSPALIEQVFEVRAGSEFSAEHQPRIVLQYGK